MTRNRAYPTDSTWTGMVAIGDTALAVTDTGGPGIPVLYVNGHVAPQKYWRHVIADLGPGWRHITYGAFVAAHRASPNPDRTVGAVLVEGAQPSWSGWSMSLSPCVIASNPTLPGPAAAAQR